MKQHSSEMKKAVTEILRGHNQLEKFLADDEFHYRIERESYLPLVIERHGQQVTVTHYAEQNSDLIADPDMEFLIGADGAWYPVALQMWNGSYYRARWSEDGKEFVNPTQVREQVSFARMWGKNLLDQGFAKGNVERVE